MLRRSISLVALSIFVAALYVGWRPALCLAQAGDIVWSSPLNLSNTAQNSLYPTVVADGYGYVHVFWCEDVDGKPVSAQENGGAPNTILYRRWDGASWSPPVDIVFVPYESVALFVAATADAENRIHIVWTGQSAIYYSSAAASQAYSARGWLTPLVVAQDSARSEWESGVAVDPLGGIHIVYATRGDQAGVYHICSRDGGKAWGPTVRISSPLDTLEEGFAAVRVISDGAGRLHATWTTYQSEGFSQAAYYARSTDSGDSWSTPLRLGYRDPGDFGTGWPYLTAVGESQLHLIYFDGVAVGRYHRISEDGGATWSAPEHILMDMEGVNGYVIPLADSAGRLHLVINMRPRATQQTGLYYAHWSGDAWSGVMPIVNKGPYVDSAHFTAAAVRLGDEIHAVWNPNLGSEKGEVWYVQGSITGLAPSPARALPLSQTPTATVSRPTAEPTATPTSEPQPLHLSPPVAARSTFSSLLVGAGAALLVTAIAVAWARARSR